MSWLAIAILSYLILAVVFLFDKYLLSKSIPNPRIYAFYVGLLGGIVFIIAFFIDFYVPDLISLLFAISAGFFFIIGLLWFYKALKSFEASRVVPVVGGLTPLFAWVLMYIFSRGKEGLEGYDLVALFLLVIGSILINYKEEKFNDKSYQSLVYSAFAAFLLGLCFTLTKYAYLEQTFWNSFIWIRVGGVISSLLLLLIFVDVRKEVFFKRKKVEYQSKKTAIIFISNQILGGGAAILQNFAIFLAPAAYISLVTALQGSQYFFLFILTLILSIKFPKIIKEEISKKIIIQKISAIFLISGGVLILLI